MAINSNCIYFSDAMIQQNTFSSQMEEMVLTVSGVARNIHLHETAHKRRYVWSTIFASWLIQSTLFTRRTFSNPVISSCLVCLRQCRSQSSAGTLQMYLQLN